MKHGIEQFKDWMARRGFSQREAAEFLGWHDTYICHVLKGRRVPDLTNAVRIERMTGIPVSAWVPSNQDMTNRTVAVNVRKALLARER